MSLPNAMELLASRAAVAGATAENVPSPACVRVPHGCARKAACCARSMKSVSNAQRADKRAPSGAIERIAARQAVRHPNTVAPWHHFLPGLHFSYAWLAVQRNFAAHA